MKTHIAGLAVAALLLAIGPTFSVHAEDVAAPAAPQTETPPPSVPRPSLAPKAAEPAPAAEETSPPPHRRYAHRYHGRYGYYRTGYWQPFPVYWPHLYHNRIHWSQIRWMLPF